MKIKKIVYVEMTPDEGKVFYNGTEYTDYVCILESAFDVQEWEEVDIPELDSESDSESELLPE